jgi:hypothetical protein
VLPEKTFISPELCDDLLGRLIGMANRTGSALATEVLSDRELETFRLI